MRDRSSLDVRVIRDESEFLALGREWNPLLERSAADGIFLTWEWMSTWWEVYGHGARPVIFTVREADGRLIGVAPLGIERGSSLPRMGLRQLGILGGSSEVAPEYQEFIIERGREAEVLEKVFPVIEREVGKGWDLLVLPFLRNGSPLLPYLLDSANAGTRRLIRKSAVTAPYIALPESWEEFLAGKSRNFRKQQKNLQNRLYNRHEVRVLEPGVDLEMDEALTGLISLNRKRWGSDGHAFRSREFVRFHRILAPKLREKGWLHFRLWEIDGRLASARYDFVYGNKLWNYQGGWLPDFASLSPGRLMIGDSVRWCIENGLGEYDFLAGDAAYKTSWATHERRLLNLEFVNRRSLPGQLFDRFRRLKIRLSRGPAHDASVSNGPASFSPST